MAGQFELALRKFAEDTGETADKAIRQIVLEVGARLVARSPVDTGRFRSNWFYSFNATLDATKGADGVFAVHGLGQMPLDVRGVHYIQNNLPYARRLEYGWSDQAPAGMVRITVAEFHSITDDAVRSARA